MLTGEIVDEEIGSILVEFTVTNVHGHRDGHMHRGINIYDLFLDICRRVVC